MTVLIVDDDIDVGFLLGITLQGMGYESSVASGGRDALELLKADRSFRFVITDLWMPEMDGIEFARQCLETCPDIPIIVISAQEETRIVDVHPNIVGVFQKPLTRENKLALGELLQGISSSSND